jgi:GNAT superfamily N-acetyltransferase
MVGSLRTPTGVRIRQIRPDDAGRLETFYAGLSEDSLNARFHGASRGIAESTARQFCGPDHQHREGLVAVTGGTHELIVGHLCLEPRTADEVEMAVAVTDAWQHRGIGRALLAAAVAWATAHGVVRLVAEIRWSNPAIFGLLRSIDRPLRITTTADGGTEAVVAVGGRLPAAA